MEGWSGGPLIPPDQGGKAYLAVAHKDEYSDFSARFRFKFRYPHAGARFLFRVQDSTRYYALDIPWCGQQNRNRHFWAGIVRADGSPWFCPADFSEIGLAESADNVVLGFGRPGPWPYMWQVRSNDGGASWEPAAFGNFPGYCIMLMRTASGALVAVHRFPYLTANVSHDGGITWDAGTILDHPIWANHRVIEVEPDVVLVLYMGHIVEPGQTDDRILRLRVTGEGLLLDHE